VSKKYLIPTVEKKCPFCRTKDVSENKTVGEEPAYGPGFSKTPINIWVCNDCQKEFDYRGKEN
jgi:transposase-like protein